MSQKRKQILFHFAFFDFVLGEIVVVLAWPWWGLGVWLGSGFAALLVALAHAHRRPKMIVVLLAGLVLVGAGNFSLYLATQDRLAKPKRPDLKVVR